MNLGAVFADVEILLIQLLLSVWLVEIANGRTCERRRVKCGNLGVTCVSVILVAEDTLAQLCARW